MAVGDSVLLALPSVHFRLAFAREVHRLCATPSTRPDAIAVELGPDCTAAAAEWVAELARERAKSRRRLPVMLGLTRPRRLAHASPESPTAGPRDDPARRLEDLPPEILLGETSTGGASVLQLSPSDSIVEAIRCAVELDLPLHGVDLEDPGPGDTSLERSVVLADPEAATAGIYAYVAANDSYAATTRDPRTAPGRERAMAARLKALLAGHRRVLFVCGLAHWKPILGLLADPALAPALPPESTPARRAAYTRVVVHPLLASPCMDLFPRLVDLYEADRIPAGRKGRGRPDRSRIDGWRICEELLAKSLRAHLGPAEGTASKRARTLDLERLPAFREMLDNLGLLAHRPVPDLGTISGTSRAMMSPGLTQVLFDTFMEFPWTRPEEHPDCPVLAPAPSDDPSSPRVRFEWAGAAGSTPARRLDWILAPDQPSTSPGWAQDWRPRSWSGADDADPFRVLHSWSPWDCLLTALSIRAGSLARGRRRVPRALPFEGSFAEGIATRETLRARSRGEDRLFVRDLEWRRRAPPSGEREDPFPAVWIFEPRPRPGSRWIVLYEHTDWMLGHVRDRRAIERTRADYGDKMIAIIGYGREERSSLEGAGGHRLDRFEGLVLYQPICWRKEQFARWAEGSMYSRNPYCRSAALDRAGRSDLARLFRARLGLETGTLDWPAALVLLAIPFARETLTVVHPQGYRIPALVRRKAAAARVEVRTVPLASFPPERIERLARSYMVPVEAMEPKLVYPKWVERLTGEKPSDYRDLVPGEWLHFGTAFPRADG